MEPSPVGRLLQHWRAQRRMSQLALAHEAGVTPRHVSFVESGRANPSREMVLTLTRALQVPLRERNQVLLAAGYAPQYRETGLDDASMAQVRARARPPARAPRAAPRGRHGPPLERAAHQHGGRRRCSPGCSTARPDHPPNVVRLMFGPLRPHVANWEQTGEALVQRVHREAIGGVPDLVTRELLDEVLALPGIPARWRTPDFARTPLPLLPVVFAKDGRTVSYFSLVTTVGTPQDITLQELRVESFFPAE